jgi:hypothetical protein
MEIKDVSPDRCVRLLDEPKVEELKAFPFFRSH